MHILNEWLNGKLPAHIKHVFYFTLWNLTDFKKSSVEELLSDHHGDNSAQFVKLISSRPEDCLVVFDGADEVILDRRNSNQQGTIAMNLVSSIIQGKELPRVCVVVTSRPGGIPGCYQFDKCGEIYGLTQDEIDKYVAKFSRGDDELQQSINEYIKEHTNIASLCYVPVQCRLVCRIVKMKKKCHTEVPKTITQLYSLSVENLAIEHILRNKYTDTVEDAEVFDQEDRQKLLSHAKLARAAMAKTPVQITFSQSEIEKYDLKEAATTCGLLTLSKDTDALLRKHSHTYSYNHLTMQEYLAAVALVSSPQEVESMVMQAANHDQLDLLFMFLCGLLGDSSCQEFLKSLGCERKMSAESLLKLVVERERKKGREHHEQSTLLLLMMIYESRHPELWSTVADYVMEDGKALDLRWKHISPVELQAMTFIFQQSTFTSLE